MESAPNKLKNSSPNRSQINKNPLRAAGTRACWHSLLEVPHLVHPSMLFFLFVGVSSAGYLLKVDYLGRSGELGGKPLFGSKFQCFLDPDFYQHFLDFDFHFGSILEHVSWFLQPFFEHRICIDFLLIFNRFLVPLIMWKNEFNVILFAKIKKSQVLKIHRFVIDFGPRFGIILEAFPHNFSYFFAIDFYIDFYIDF